MYCKHGLQFCTPSPPPLPPSARYRKRGLYATPTKFGISFTNKALNQAGALVHIYLDGTVLVTHGGVEMGQGLHTKVAMVRGSVLGGGGGGLHCTSFCTPDLYYTPFCTPAHPHTHPPPYMRQVVGTAWLCP